MLALTTRALKATGLPSGEARDESAWLDALGDVTQPDGLLAIDRLLVRLCRQRGALRAVLARLAWFLVINGAWRTLGYGRLSNYAAERLGVSGKWVDSLALVAHAFLRFPRLEEALASGTLGWTKVRLLAWLPLGEDQEEWIGLARSLTAEQLAKRVREVDRGSLEGGALEDEPLSSVFEVRCSPEVRLKWHHGKGYASRVAGRMLQDAEAAELIAAEVLSAIPIDEPAAAPAAREDADVSQPNDSVDEEAPMPEPVPASGPAWQGYGALQVLLDGAADADPFELDARLRRAFSLEQRLDARMGPLLFRVWGRWLHRALGYSTREAYARERLGMDPTRARALVRLERAAMRSEPFARAYRSGGLSWVKAALLVPLVDRDPLGRFMGEWVTWAQRVTVRRLRADVDWAVTLQDVDPEAFRRTGGLPADREIGSQLPNRTSEAGAPSSVTDAERPALRAASEPCTVHMVGPPDVVQLLRAVLCTVRRRMEAVDGKLPTEGQALGVMLDYAFACWGIGNKVPSEHRVFERDGWLCRVPGCTSMENLQKHHIQFRSRGGTDDPPNRVSLCAFHHLRGIHAERIRCTGRAPDELRWEIGTRPGKAPLAVYGSGDVEIVDGAN